MPVNDLLSGVRGRREEHLRMDNNYDQEWNTENSGSAGTATGNGAGYADSGAGSSGYSGSEGYAGGGTDSPGYTGGTGYSGGGTGYPYEDHRETRSDSYSGSNYYQYSAPENNSRDDYAGAPSNTPGKKGAKGKVALAVILALVFGLCAGAGVWGVNRYLDKQDTTVAVQDAGSVGQTAEGGTSSETGKAAKADAETEAEGETEAEAAAVTESEPGAGTERAAEPEAEQPAEAGQAEAPAASQEDVQGASEEAAAAAPAAEAGADQADQPADAQAGQAAASAQQDQGMSTQQITNEAGLIISDSDPKGRETQITKVVDQVMPSIVSVYNSYTQQMQFFGQIYSQEAESTGSGIIIGKTETQLLMVTNNHVVEGAEQLRVLFIDGETCEAEILGTDASNDLAVISVNLADLGESTMKAVKVAVLGNSDKTIVGEQVIAIGNALGYGQSVTTGIISATEREFTGEDGITGVFIQTDAPINPGNSGGALVNIDGEVIGINSSKIGGNAIEGMGFAIPISKAIPILGEMITQEQRPKVPEEKQGTIGISGQSVTADVARAYNMPQGVYVFQILENGGAANSDLQPGDVITAINGVEVTSMEGLQKQLQYYEAGTTVTLTVMRQDQDRTYKEVKVDVTLGTKESLQSSSGQDQGQPEAQEGQEQPSGGSSDGQEVPSEGYPEGQYGPEGGDYSGYGQPGNGSGGSPGFPFGF